MPINSMNGDGGGFDFDLPDAELQPEQQVLPAKPDVSAQPQHVSDEATERLEDLLGQPGVDAEAVTWDELPGIGKPVQPDDGVFDPPSADDIQLQ